MPSRDFFDYGVRRFHRWMEVATVVVVMHVGGGIIASIHWPEPEADPEPTGAVFMELAALAVAPLQPEDLAIGPLVEESVATPVPVKESMPEDLELPQVQEAPLAPEIDVALPKAKPVEAVKEVEEVETLQEHQVTEINTVAAAASAPPKMEVPPDTTIKAQTVGAKAKPTQAEVTWQKALLLHLNRHKRYPAAARNKRNQGVAKVEFKIDARGKLVEARLTQTTGSKLLDEEALSVLKRASPFPPPPDRGAGEHVSLALPVEFRITR